MSSHQQPAFVLHARPYRETSLLLECLTPEFGRLGVVARGVRKRGAKTAQADLQPFQPLALSFVLRGELATLRVAEPEGRAWLLHGEVLLAGLYVNELLVRLSVRQDPHHGLYELYAQTLARLAGEPGLAWTLRRFERDLLEALGYGMVLREEADSDQPVSEQAEYRYVPEQGPVPAGGGSGLVLRGSDLLALADDHMPDAAALRRLRLLLRGVLSHHLGGRAIKSWQLSGHRAG